MARMFSSDLRNMIWTLIRIIAILTALTAGIVFAVAICIFQEPVNRYWGGDTAPSGELDAFPLVVIGLCLFWGSLVLIKAVVKKPIRPRRKRLPDAAAWVLLIVSATITLFFSAPFRNGSTADFDRARKIEGGAVVTTYIASILHFVVFCFTMYDCHVVKKAEKLAREEAAAKAGDIEAMEHVEHMPCQKCKNIELPPAYENVNVEACSSNQASQVEVAEAGKGAVIDLMPLNASQSGLSVVDNEGRVIGA